MKKGRTRSFNFKAEQTTYYSDIFYYAHAEIHCCFVCNRDFLPGAGPLLHLSTPTTSENVRVDTGVRQGEDWRLFDNNKALT